MNTPAMPELPDSATVLPDGSAFAIASFPLPPDHWLYAPHEYRDGEEEPIELPSPILSHQAHGDIGSAAIRYAVRSATMCGKEPDFDPDALVQNAMYALCGPFGGATLQAHPAEVSDAEIYALWVEHCETTEKTTRQLVCDFARAILALRPQAVPMTEDEFVACLVKANCVGVVKMSYDSGPYDVTRPSINASKLKEAFEDHHGITAPAGGERQA